MRISGTEDLLFLLSFAYAAIITFRILRYLVRTALPDVDGRYLVAILTIFLLVAAYSATNGIGESSAMLGLFWGTSIIAIITVFYGGISAGSLAKSGSPGFFTAMGLFAAQISIGFIEPILSAGFATAMIGLNIYLEYHSTYSSMQDAFWNSSAARYLLVYPPLVLVFTLTNVLYLTPRIGQFTTMVIMLVLTGIGALIGVVRD